MRLPRMEQYGLFAMNIWSIIGIIAFVIVLVVVLVIWRIWNSLISLANVHRTPSRIHLKAAPDAHWADQSSFEALRRQAHDFGLTDIDTFTIEEMPGLVLHSLFNQEKWLLCVIYEYPQMGLWADCITQYEDGGSMTVTNAKMGHQLEHQPNHDKIYLVGESLPSLLGILLSRRPERAFRAFDGTPEAFVTAFEKAYKEEMDWRNAKGGASEEEIRRIAETSGIKVNDAMIQAQRLICEQESCEGIAVALEERFRETHEMSDADWRKFAQQLVFVHDKMNGDMVKDCISRAAGREFFFDPANASTLESMSARQAFDTLNARLANDVRFTRIGELADPLEADVYQAASPAHPD